MLAFLKVKNVHYMRMSFSIFNPLVCKALLVVLCWTKALKTKKYSYTFLKEKRDKTKRLYLGHTQKMTHYNNARSSEKKMRSILLKISKKYFLENGISCILILCLKQNYSMFRIFHSIKH